MDDGLPVGGQPVGGEGRGALHHEIAEAAAGGACGEGDVAAVLAPGGEFWVRLELEDEASAQDRTGHCGGVAAGVGRIVGEVEAEADADDARFADCKGVIGQDDAAEPGGVGPERGEEHGVVAAIGGGLFGGRRCDRPCRGSRRLGGG